MGLCANGSKLGQIKQRKKDDIAIEHFRAMSGPLNKVDPSAAISTYLGPADEAERALLSIFEFANKGMAHLTTQASISQFTDAHLEIACKGIPVLLQNKLYAKLGMEMPPPPKAQPKDHA